MAEELCLYRVELVKSTVAYVVAHGRSEAEAVAKANAGEAANMEDWDVYVADAEPKLISSEWQGSLPYAPVGVPERKVGEWVEVLSAPPEEAV